MLLSTLHAVASGSWEKEDAEAQRTRSKSSLASSIFNIFRKKITELICLLYAFKLQLQSI